MPIKLATSKERVLEVVGQRHIDLFRAAVPKR